MILFCNFHWFAFLFWVTPILIWVPFGFVMGVSWERDRLNQGELRSVPDNYESPSEFFVEKYIDYPFAQFFFSRSKHGTC